jgi:hypothetical protein
MSGVGIYLFYDKPYWASVSNFISSTLGISGVGVGLSAEENKMRMMGTKSIHINYPFQPIEAGMAWYYLVQAAYNVEAMISLLEMSICVELQPIIVVIADDDSKNNNNNSNFHYVSVGQIHVVVIFVKCSSITYLQIYLFLVHQYSDCLMEGVWYF